jgi:hypothetical protein
MAAQTASLDGATEVRDVHLKVDTRFANVKVVGEEGMEVRDKNMPRNLHNAAELFLRCGLVANAEKLQETTSAMFKILSSDPDGAAHSLGRGAVCWSCGCAAEPGSVPSRRRRRSSEKTVAHAGTAASRKTRKRKRRSAVPAAPTMRTGSASSPTRSRRSPGSRPRR